MNISWKIARIGNTIFFLALFVMNICLLYVFIGNFIQKPQISDMIIILFQFLGVVCSILFLYGIIQRIEFRFTDTGMQTIRRGCVISSIKWDDYSAADFERGTYGMVIVTLFPLQHMETDRKKMTVEQMEREGIYQFVLDKWFVYSKEGREVVHFIERKYGAKL